MFLNRSGKASVNPKVSGSKVRKAGAARQGHWRHTVSANQIHCLHVCFSPDYGIYT